MKESGEWKSMVCTYFAHVADILSKGAENTALVRTWVTSLSGCMAVQKSSLPGLHMLYTRMFGARQTSLAGLLWVCRMCREGSLYKARTCQRKKGEAGFIPLLSKLAQHISLNSKTNLFNSLLIYTVGIKPK